MTARNRTADRVNDVGIHIIDHPAINPQLIDEQVAELREHPPIHASIVQVFERVGKHFPRVTRCSPT
ncbi:hypothetical protein [Williamsia sterculiae]|uniref:hypothetical protein n=1 Tax=Williamsia sterculiae TaxID=1344003 RepID=UPI0013565145|nr:hypothetical protein [Williamsia sterculiae]